MTNRCGRLLRRLLRFQQPRAVIRLELAESDDVVATGDLAEDSALRLDVANAVATLDERNRELIALRFGADLTAKQIAEVLGVKTNAVEVALHRALGRLKVLLEPGEGSSRRLTATEREALDS